MHSLRIDTVLATAVRVAYRHALLFAGLIAATALPWAALLVASPAFAGESTDASLPYGSDTPLSHAALPLLAYSLLLGAMLAGAVSFVTVRHLQGERVSALDALKQTVRPLVRVVLTTVLVWSRILLWCLPMFLVTGLTVGSGFASENVMMFAVLLGAVGAVFSAIEFVKLWVAVPAAVVDELGPFAACRRSAELTKGNRLRIFGLLLLAFVVLVVLMVVVELVLTGAPPATMVWISLVQQGVMSVATATLAASAYFALRSAREIVDFKALAAAFS